ncbi:MAG TPA: hypothetical protein PK299_11855 [Anaerolineales bacterium]|nr:hypothetical protein [Anaerolineales bacterium]
MPDEDFKLRVGLFLLLVSISVVVVFGIANSAALSEKQAAMAKAALDGNVQVLPYQRFSSYVFMGVVGTVLGLWLWLKPAWNRFRKPAAPGKPGKVMGFIVKMLPKPKEKKK